MGVSQTMTWEVRNGGSDTACSGGFRGGNSPSPAPAPTVVGAPTGGSVAAGTYYCVVTYSNGGFQESAKSPETSVTLTGTSSKFTVTAPPSSNTISSMSSWNLYVGTTTGGPYFSQGGGNLTLGANQAVTSTPPTTGSQPPGTDFTQQLTAQLQIDNSTITTSVTAAVITFTGYTPTAADVGNTLIIISGTNLTVGSVYEIIAFTSTTWTVDRVIPSAGTTTDMVANMGGCHSTPGKTCSLLGSTTLQTIFVKYTSTPFTCTATNNVSGRRITLGAGVYLVGYDTTRTLLNTDANRPILQPTAASVTVLTITGGVGQTVRNFVINNPSAFASVTGVVINSITCAAFNVAVSNLNNGFNATGNGCIVQNCVATSCGTGFLNGSGSPNIDCCVADSCTSTGFNISGGFATDCIAIGTTGANFSNGTNSWAVFINCTAYGATGAGGDGFSLSNYGKVINCVAYNNSRTDFRTGGSLTAMLINCAGATKTIWRDDQVVGFITLTANPFTNAAGKDFSLNNIAGGGAAIRAAGLPTTYVGMPTSNYADIGAAQHADLVRGLGIYDGGNL